MAWQRLRTEPDLAFYVHAPTAFLKSRASRLSLDVPIAGVRHEDAPDVFSKALPVIEMDATVPDRPGEASTETAPVVLDSLNRCLDDVVTGLASAVVTNPIQKSVLLEDGFPHPGHTDYLQDVAERVTGKPCRAVMMLAGPELRTVPVTVHVPLKDVPGLLSIERIVETASITAHDLESRFGILSPRIIVTGLNPHAGEDGNLGVEETTIIGPAVERLREQGLDVTGPLPADTVFHESARRRYDAIIAMYHDQALIPAKTLAFEQTVNVTLGLPFVRTSPDHGTALDIAGTGKASPESLIAAIRLARDLVAPAVRS